MDLNKRYISAAAATTAVGAIFLAAIAVDMSRPEHDAEQYAGWMDEAPNEGMLAPRPLNADEHVQALLPGLFDLEEDTVTETFDAIAAVYKVSEPEAIEAITREETASAMVELFADADPSTKEGLTRRETIARFLIASVKGEESRTFANQVLSSATPSVQAAAVLAMLEPGALRDPAMKERALELARTPVIADHDKPTVLKRFLGKKAKPEILAMLSTEISDFAARRAAVEIQNYHEAADLGLVLAKLEDRGFLDDAKKMPWLSGKLLDEHIRTAQDAELMRALKAVWLRPHLTRTTFQAVQERIAHADPAIRRMVARLVPDAVKYEGLGAQAGEEILSARMGLETDPAVKGQLEGSLDAVRGLRRGPEAPVEGTEPLTP